MLKILDAIVIVTGCWLLLLLDPIVASH